MKNLKELRMTHWCAAWFSAPAMNDLREALPNCAIGQ
jgi:hypothetical protein